ncbi:stalk domain-containing protein [Fontibacillus sp. BL9]|uniref:stalk domain-containing protein n=1 Tax=Fontibacillus sp. BL9 TaxID=3389971 RepID=UPI00397E2323
MKKMGYLLTGIALGLTLSVTSPVLAQNVKSITAKLNSTVSVLVNGEKVHLNAKPINYNNLNYLPVGEISRILGFKVDWDAEKHEIMINDDGIKEPDLIENESVPSVKVFDFDDVSLAFEKWDKEEAKLANIKISIQENNKILLGLYDEIYNLQPNKDYFYDQSTGKGYFEESYLKTIIPNAVLEILTPKNISIKDGAITLLN